MGPLLPLLFLSPILLGAAWVFRAVPLILGPCVLVALGIPLEYCRQFARFANNDPDRLQSEEYRYEMSRLQMVAGKDLPYPVPADTLTLPPPTPNPTQPEPQLPSEDTAVDKA